MITAQSKRNKPRQPKHKHKERLEIMDKIKHGQIINLQERASRKVSQELWQGVLDGVKLNNLERRIRTRFPLIFCSGQGLTPQERSMLTGMISDGSCLLSLQESNSQRLEHLLRTLIGSMKLAAGIDGKALSAGYAIALDGIAFYVVEKAIKDVIVGRAEGLHRTFLPTPAELADYCRKLEGKVRATIAYAARLLEAREEPKQARVNPDKLAALQQAMMGQA